MKALLFDMGGVILDLNPRAVIESWAQAAGADAQDVMRLWGIDGPYEDYEINAIDFTEFTAHLSQRLGISITPEQWLDGWNALFVDAFHSIAAKLPEVAARIPLYAYTNTNPEHEVFWRARFGNIFDPFEHLYVSSKIGRRKPYVESYQWVAQDMGYAPADILFLDDNRANVEGANDAGMQTLHVTGPDVTEALLDRVIADFDPRD